MSKKKGAQFVNNLSRLIEQRVAELKRKGEYANQARIAIDLGIDPATLSLYKNNKVKSIDIDLWRRMSDYFGVDGDEIFNVKSERN